MNSDIIGINLLKFWRGFLSDINFDLSVFAYVSCKMNKTDFDFIVEYNEYPALRDQEVNITMSTLINCSNSEQLGKDKARQIIEERRYAGRSD